MRINSWDEFNKIKLNTKIMEVEIENRIFKRHINPDGSIGGFVEKTAKIAKTCFIEFSARVSGDTWVSGNARVSGNAWVSKVDVNILDDIEFVYGKEATQKGTKLLYHKELKTIIAIRKKYKGLIEDSFEEKPSP